MEWSPSSDEDGWNVPAKIRDISRQTQGSNAKQSAPFSGTPNVEGGNPLLAWIAKPISRSIVNWNGVSILNSAVRDGIGPLDLAELQLELTERSDIHGSALHHIVTGSIAKLMKNRPWKRSRNISSAFRPSRNCKMQSPSKPSSLAPSFWPCASSTNTSPGQTR